MAGTAASQMIFFIAAMIVATAVAGVFVTTVINLSKDIKDTAEKTGDEFNIQVKIINDETKMPYNDTCSTLVLYLKNTGSSSIDYGKTTVTILINGTYFTKDNMTFQLLDGATEWGSGTVLQVTLSNITLASGDHSLKLIVGGKKFSPFPFKI